MTCTSMSKPGHPEAGIAPVYAHKRVQSTPNERHSALRTLFIKVAFGIVADATDFTPLFRQAELGNQAFSDSGHTSVEPIGSIYDQ